MWAKCGFRLLHNFYIELPLCCKKFKYNESKYFVHNFALTILVEDIPLCLNNINKIKFYVYLVCHNYIIFYFYSNFGY